MKRKKIFKGLLIAVMMLVNINRFIPAHANGYKVISVTNAEISEDLVIETIIEEVEESIHLNKNRSLSQKSGRKTVNYYNGKNVLQWSITVEGKFSYGNGTSWAITSNIITKTNESAWKLDNEKQWISGKTAFASVRARNYFGPLVMNTVNREVTLTCSATGQLS